MFSRTIANEYKWTRNRTRSKVSLPNIFYRIFLHMCATKNCHKAVRQLTCTLTSPTDHSWIFDFLLHHQASIFRLVAALSEHIQILAVQWRWRYWWWREENKNRLSKHCMSTHLDSLCLATRVWHCLTRCSWSLMSAVRSSISAVTSSTLASGSTTQNGE